MIKRLSNVQAVVLTIVVRGHKLWLGVLAVLPDAPALV